MGHLATSNISTRADTDTQTRTRTRCGAFRWHGVRQGASKTVPVATGSASMHEGGAAGMPGLGGWAGKGLMVCYRYKQHAYTDVLESYQFFCDAWLTAIGGGGVAAIHRGWVTSMRNLHLGLTVCTGPRSSAAFVF